MTAGGTNVVPMTSAHVDALMDFEHELFGTEAWSADSYRSELDDTRTRYYVAVEGDDGALLGWGGVLVAGDQAEILTVGVVPSAQRRGLARQMLAVAVHRGEAPRRARTVPRSSRRQRSPPSPSTAPRTSSSSAAAAATTRTAVSTRWS